MFSYFSISSFKRSVAHFQKRYKSVGETQKNLLSATPPLGIVCGEYSENYP